MKRIICCIMLIALFLSGCGVSQPENNKISIVTTNFAYYDFAKAVAGDFCDVDMLIKPSMDVHTYEPSPNDIIKISDSDLFIYGGGENDNWVKTVLENTKGTKALPMIELTGLEEDHEHKHTHDEHIWTSPVNVIKIVNVICENLSEADLKNASYYKENAENYILKLEELDKAFEEVTSSGKRNILVFGDRFPFKHFTDRYGLTYFSAFSGCADEAEPDPKTLAELYEIIEKESIPVVFYIEMSGGKMAKTIANDTKAKALMLHSCHTVTSEEFQSGETYLSLMEQNLKNIREALN